MNDLLVAYGHGLGHGLHGSLGPVISVVAHAVIWSVVARLMWHAPLLVAAVAVLVSGAWIYSRRGHGRG